MSECICKVCEIRNRFLKVLDCEGLLEHFEDSQPDGIYPNTILFGNHGVFDSLDKTGIIIRLEDEFDLDISDVKESKIETYEDIYNIITEEKK